MPNLLFLHFLVGARINVYILLQLKCQSLFSCLKNFLYGLSNVPNLGKKQCLLLLLFSTFVKKSVILMFSVRKGQVGKSTQSMQILLIIA